MLSTFFNNVQNRKYISKIAFAFALLVARNIFYRWRRKCNNSPPGPVGLPLIGSLFSLLDAPKFAAYLASNYGSITLIYIGSKPFVFLHSIDTINQVFYNEHALDRDSWHDTFTFQCCKESEICLPLVNEKYWLPKRRHFQSIILPRINSTLINIVHNKSLNSHVFQSIDDCIANDRLWHFSNDVNFIQFHSLWNACFGTFLEYDSKEAKEEYELMERLLNGFEVDLFLRYMNIANFIPNIISRNFLHSYKEFGMFLKQQLLTHLGYDDSVLDSDNHEWDGHFEQVRKDVNACAASKIIASHRENGDIFTSMSGIIQSLVTFFIAGVQNSIHTNEYALVLLAKYPKVQQRIYEEIQVVFGDHNIMMEDVNIASAIQKLHVLRAFFQEVLRLSCVGPLGIPHYNRNCDIMVNGRKPSGEPFLCKIPKGSIIMSDVQTANKSDVYWKMKCNGKQNELCLNAWMDKNGKFKINMNKDRMVTFGVGPRDCAGKSLALRSAYVLLSKLLMKYEFQIPEGYQSVEIKQSYEFINILKPKIPLLVRKRF